MVGGQGSTERGTKSCFLLFFFLEVVPQLRDTGSSHCLVQSQCSWKELQLFCWVKKHQLPLHSSKPLQIVTLSRALYCLILFPVPVQLNIDAGSQPREVFGLLRNIQKITVTHHDQVAAKLCCFGKYFQLFTRIQHSDCDGYSFLQSFRSGKGGDKRNRWNSPTLLLYHLLSQKQRFGQ